MNILIIGNGFDIEHGLPTGYTDFLKQVISILEKSDDCHGLCKALEKAQMKSEFYEIISSNIWINYFIDRYNKNLLCGIKWIDFEYEVSKLILDFEQQVIKDGNIFIDLDNESFFKMFMKLIESRTFEWFDLDLRYSKSLTVLNSDVFYQRIYSCKHLLS